MSNSISITSGSGGKTSSHISPPRESRELKEEIDFLPNGVCNLTRSLNSTESALEQRTEEFLYYGIMFRISSSKVPIDILTIEIDTETGRRGGEADVPTPVEVYTLEGPFHDVWDKPESWTLIVNTTAIPTPTSRGNIIPIADFPPITMPAGTDRSFYIYIPTITDAQKKETTTEQGEERKRKQRRIQNLTVTTGGDTNLYSNITTINATNIDATNEKTINEEIISINATENENKTITSNNNETNEESLFSINAIESENKAIFINSTKIDNEEIFAFPDTTKIMNKNNDGTNSIASRPQSPPTSTEEEKRVKSVIPTIYAGDGADIENNMVYANDFYITNTIGYAFASPGTRFPKDKFYIRQFHGYIYYRTSIDCNSEELISRKTSIDYELYVDQPPFSIVSLVNQSVSDILKDALFLDTIFIVYQNFHALVLSPIIETRIVSKDNHGDGCPSEWSNCTKMIASASFSHDTSLHPAKLQYDLLMLRNRMNVKSDMLEMQYCGDTPFKIDYWITLEGIPMSGIMDNVMIEYFQDTTKTFLSLFFEQHNIFGVEFIQQILQGPTRRRIVEIQNTNEDNVLYHRTLQFGEENDRQTSSSTYSEIRVRMYGAYIQSQDLPNEKSKLDQTVDWDQLQKQLNDIFVNDEQKYILQLRRGITLPGKIGEPSRYKYFDGITGVSARIIHENEYETSSNNSTSSNIIMKGGATHSGSNHGNIMNPSVNNLFIFAVLMICGGSFCFLWSLLGNIFNIREEKRKLGLAERRQQQKIDKVLREQERRRLSSKRNNNEQQSLIQEQLYEEEFIPSMGDII